MKDYEVFGFPGGSVVKNPPAMQETWVWSLGGEDPLEKGMTTPSSTLAWEIPWTEEPGGLQSMGSQKSDTTYWLHHHHHEDFVQRQEDPTFVPRLQLTKDMKQLSNSVNRNLPFQGQGTRCEVEVPLRSSPVRFSSLPSSEWKLANVFSLSSSSRIVGEPGVYNPVNSAENHSLDGKITLGFWLISSTAHLISSTIGPCDKIS